MILSKCHVACNIYISAGKPVYRAVLERLLNEAQNHQILRSSDNDSIIRIVHAFADTQYDRSSFHLAGSPWAIATLATAVTTNAMQVLAPLKQQEHQQSSLEHPTVGIVDHISILPLHDTHDVPQMSWDEWRNYYNDKTPVAIHLPDLSSSSDSQDERSFLSRPSTTLPSGWVAWTIGWNLSQKENLPVDVLYYGYAHPTKIPLAQVRREKTNFFRSTGTATTTAQMGQCTIGAPPHFVENYNLRLTTRCSKSVARSLTKAVREKDGGLPFVEALTLPYGSQDRFEVACNLLNPQVTSTHDVDAKVAEFWSKKEMDDYLEKAYRVGTTKEQCLKAIQDRQPFGMEQLEQHDEIVLQRFQGFGDH